MSMLLLSRKYVCLAGGQSGWSLRKVFSVSLLPGKNCSAVDKCCLYADVLLSFIVP